ncbi:MAG: Gfo/Idh/MocA family oxidoreductase [Flammeovirgaceae bacterium]|nr:Gfo/Idh/MocA family oxidoreductase [Flammeovirgaceae bacterium]
MKKNISRRGFIGASSLATAGVAMGFNSLPFPSVGNIIGANDNINIGVIGTGGRGSWAVKVAQGVPGINVTACCDILPKNLERGLSQAAEGAKGYKDYKKMLENKDLDAIVVATPLYLHSEMALDAIDAGKHVYCEKTMAFTIDQSKQLVEKVKNSKVVFQVGYQQRVNPLFLKINDIISGGYIGDVKHIQSTWNRNGDWRKPVSDPALERHINWRMYLEYSGGLMAELSSHQIDVVNWLLGTHPLVASGLGGVDFWKDGRETYDNISAVFEYPDGVKSQFTCLTTNAHEGFSMKFYGTKASIVVNREQGQQGFIYPEPVQGANSDVDGVSGATKELMESGEAIPILVGDPSKDDSVPTGNAFEHFAECIKESKQPNADVMSGHYGSVAVAMGNMAMRNRTTEMWKEEYTV